MYLAVKTNFTPKISYDSSAPSSGASAKILTLLKPSLDVQHPLFGNKVHHFAPYGEPSGWGLFILASLAGLCAYGGYELVRKLL